MSFDKIQMFITVLLLKNQIILSEGKVHCFTTLLYLNPIYLATKNDIYVPKKGLESKKILSNMVTLK